MNNKLFKPLSMLVLTSLLVGIFTLAFPVATVSAQAVTPPDGAPQADQNARQGIRLERLFEREQRLVKNQAESINVIEEKLKSAENRIAELKADGKNTEALETALKNFQADVQEARAKNASIDALVKRHTGFDDSGKVTDLAAARETVREIGQQLREVRRDLRPVLRELARTFREFTRDNRDV